MPLGIVTSQAEIDLVQEIWPEPSEGMPTVRSGIIEFAPAKSRQIVDEIQSYEPEDEGAAIRFINRIVDIAGKSFIPGDDNPVETESEVGDIEEEDSADGEGFYLNESDAEDETE